MELPENGPFKAFVGNLPWDCTHGDIEAILSKLELSDEDIHQCQINLVRDRETDKFKGFSYVEVPSRDALSSLLGLNGAEFGGRVLKIDLATPKTGGGGGRRGRGGPGGFRGGDRGGDRGGFRHNDRGDFRDHKNDGVKTDRNGFQTIGRDGKPEHRRGGGYRQNRRNSHREDVVIDTTDDANRPRLNLKPLTTDPAALEAKRKREAEEEAARKAKLFQA